MKQASIFLTGATGAVGSHLIQQLAPLNIPLRALVRAGSQPATFEHIPNLEIVTGDLADPESFESSLKGVEKAFLLSNSSEQAESLQLNFVEAAHRAGVKHIVKLSQLAASESSPVRFLRYHAKVENRIKELGFAYTFLRPNLYMQGLLSFKDYIKDQGQFFASAGNAGVSVVDVRDIAAVAAACLVEPGHENKVYDITGPDSLTHYEMAEIFSQELAKPVRFIDVTAEQMQGGLRAAGFPEWQVGGLIEDYAHYARGEAAKVAETVKVVTGSSAGSLRQFIKDYRSSFLS
ncbi:NAD(P)-dependent oxidoreductase [Dyadobacter endophyticus]|uniref:NAD(P)-dependent oxidoreductase n=1 Tax=Dyadobacter endophyticus TaxID=1749036 RepID=A0ABQ1YPH7_9BACT|nr:SDR family oxidoreductase [Dyadobacter endophyticus]GGH33791.1 NAD(P)-dependent oxidoreductase [Dyadobacter endophyticus]